MRTRRLVPCGGALLARVLAPAICQQAIQKWLGRGRWLEQAAYEALGRQLGVRPYSAAAVMAAAIAPADVPPMLRKQ